MKEVFGKLPAKGTRDILPSDWELREQVIGKIKEIYTSYGFCGIETPCLEDIGLLTANNGGDNEKLIFKILKRGEKLDLQRGDLCDLGLRYDLTLPFTRFYANNSGTLPTVFKAMQLGNVWRADKPQKGRFRQFMQCDMDIIGEKSNIAECELILATCETFKALGFSDFIVRINDRRMLRALSDYAGFAPEWASDVFILLDKLDKIGFDGVLSELSLINKKAAAKLIEVVRDVSESEDGLHRAGESLGDEAKDSIDNLAEIIQVTQSMGANVHFDITLVRGMNYYTGSIFEVSANGIGYALAGGGRYDELIGKYTGTSVPACGFSIGLERIVELLAERKAQNAAAGGKAFLLDKNADAQELEKAFLLAAEARKSGRATVCKKAKNFRAQTNSLKEQGYTAMYLIQGAEVREIVL